MPKIVIGYKSAILVLFFSLFAGWNTLRAQNLFLADQYLKSGEPDKALTLYLQWFERNKRYNPNIYDKVLEIYLHKGAYDKALEWIEQNAAMRRRFLFDVDRYHIYRLLGQSAEAEQLYKKLNQTVKQTPGYAASIANRLKKFNYLDEAAFILQTALQKRESPGLYLSLGNIYAEKGETARMIDAYLKTLLSNNGYFHYITGILSRYITADPSNKYNRLLKISIVRYLSEDTSPVLLKLLQWLYVRENNFRKAFIQLKGLYLQGAAEISEFADLASGAYEAAQYDAAQEIIRYALQNLEPGNKTYDRLMVLLSRTEDRSRPGDNKLISLWKKRALRVSSAARRAEIYSLILDRQIYDLKDFSSASILIDSLLKSGKNTPQAALWREKKADMLLLKRRFNAAAIEYTLLREDFPYEELNYRALYKIALASFFANDFDWAHITLKTLKKAAGKKIANDALYLDFLIISNREKDSLQPGLRFFSKVFFENYARNYQQALRMLDDSLMQFKNKKIYDDLLVLKARLMMQTGREAETGTLWNEILSFEADKIYREEALYRLGIIFEKYKNRPDKAKAFFQRVLTEHPQGYWFEAAQQHYRRLIEQDTLP